MTIDRFDGDYQFLSNFYMCPRGVEIDGILYPSVEHAYQANKSGNNLERLQIATLNTPGQAKRAGRQVEMREGFEEQKKDVMLACLLSKFMRDPDLKQRLVDTGEITLIEGNTWGDRTWGKTLDSDGEWVGMNMLGELLMQVRNLMALI